MNYTRESRCLKQRICSIAQQNVKQVGKFQSIKGTQPADSRTTTSSNQGAKPSEASTCKRKALPPSVDAARRDIPPRARAPSNAKRSRPSANPAHRRPWERKKAGGNKPPTWEDNGRDDRIRTCGILLPKQARYQTAPRPERNGYALYRKPRRANANRPPIVSTSSHAGATPRKHAHATPKHDEPEARDEDALATLQLLLQRA